uniref:Uncharacterized protein n=1 Tax=Anguilla anguilla TaxID=7936 RepID=A0A0E9U0N4_ANGAN
MWRQVKPYAFQTPEKHHGGKKIPPGMSLRSTGLAVN